MAFWSLRPTLNAGLGRKLQPSVHTKDLPKVPLSEGFGTAPAVLTSPSAPSTVASARRTSSPSRLKSLSASDKDSTGGKPAGTGLGLRRAGQAPEKEADDR